MFARHDIAKLVGTAIAVAAVGMTAPGSAAADPTDDAFIHRVNADAVSNGNRSDMIQRAQEVCSAFTDGISVARLTTDLDSSAMTPRMIALFMNDAVQSYCPRYSGLLSR
jgi:Protein of unknown function (DUF732)